MKFRSNNFKNCFKDDIIPRMKNLMVILGIFLILILVLIFWRQKNQEIKKPQVITSSSSAITTPTGTPFMEKTPTPQKTLTPEVRQIKSKVLIENVPFAPQAPFAQWEDARFQDGCEEAATILAVYWARGLSLDKTKMQEEIIKMSAFQTEKYQEFRDTSVKDTAERLIKGYFDFNNFEVKENISLEDIKNELRNGNLVIVPANGQALNNPHFTAPGPERHNIVIRGFDDTSGIFITNDPGIKEGELYTYPQNVLFNAIRDYPTGYHQPILQTKKVMIVLQKS